MRKLTASFFISLDGVVEAPQNWHFPYFNPFRRATRGLCGCAPVRSTETGSSEQERLACAPRRRARR